MEEICFNQQKPALNINIRNNIMHLNIKLMQCVILSLRISYELLSILRSMDLFTIDDDENITIIDFPKMAYASHRNAEMYD
ncbi:hypothetical protein L1987_81204 [Smallanthus sonchifolius]|uniref:Uncharacterized protein n=1 Tax=Smallanthus sonchifolius TaxID=185202 RepID=A0ACB8YQF4_9ASTR|nr:hypothetical protein L1987_81204 [Smallanthus sonchifolius]